MSINSRAIATGEIHHKYVETSSQMSATMCFYITMTAAKTSLTHPQAKKERRNGVTCIFRPIPESQFPVSGGRGGGGAGDGRVPEGGQNLFLRDTCKSGVRFDIKFFESSNPTKCSTESI